jgi:hypothetical protein
MIPNLLDLTGDFFAKPYRLQHLQCLAIPKMFLLKVKSSFYGLNDAAKKQKPVPNHSKGYKNDRFSIQKAELFLN